MQLNIMTNRKTLLHSSFTTRLELSHSSNF